MAVQGNLCRLVQRFKKELIVYVADPAVPPGSNPAEESLRHLIDGRWTSVGIRLQQGTYAKRLRQLFGTWGAESLDPFLERRQLLPSS